MRFYICIESIKFKKEHQVTIKFGDFRANSNIASPGESDTRLGMVGANFGTKTNPFNKTKNDMADTFKGNGLTAVSMPKTDAPQMALKQPVGGPSIFGQNGLKDEQSFLYA